MKTPNIERLRGIHSPSRNPAGKPWCRACNQSWPCDVASLIDEHDQCTPAQVVENLCTELAGLRGLIAEARDALTETMGHVPKTDATYASQRLNNLFLVDLLDAASAAEPEPEPTPQPALSPLQVAANTVWKVFDERGYRA